MKKLSLKNQIKKTIIPMQPTSRRVFFVFFFAFSISAGYTQIVSAEEMTLNVPLGLNASALQIPADNPMTVEKVALGRFLFFDKRPPETTALPVQPATCPRLRLRTDSPFPPELTGSRVEEVPNRLKSCLYENPVLGWAGPFTGSPGHRSSE